MSKKSVSLFNREKNGEGFAGVLCPGEGCKGRSGFTSVVSKSSRTKWCTVVQYWQLPSLTITHFFSKHSAARLFLVIVTRSKD